MTISPPEREAKVKVVVDVDPVPTSFEKWGNQVTSIALCQKDQKPPRGFGIFMLTPMISTVTPVT